MSSGPNPPAPLKELSPAAALLLMLSLPSFKALREICGTPGHELSTRLLRENLGTIALAIAQKQCGPGIWSDIHTLVTARTRNLGPPPVSTVGSEEAEFGVKEVQILEETLDTLEEWHEIIVPLMLLQQQQLRRTRPKSKQPSRVLKLSGANPALTEFIPIDKAFLRYWTILIACVPEACIMTHSPASMKMEHYLSNFGYVEWAFEVFRGADEDEIRAVWEVGMLCARTGLGHLEDIVEAVLISAPAGFGSFEAETLLMEITNVHLEHMTRMLGAEVGWEE
ncbi:hypothetical protein C7212DRAFT_345367 [Tuber magnatum]|uniref:Uncharacterized protein n=1 Tax=Tuber magnatum TaxID=42249 RepID=A0A317SLN9_9PEZI|nr:hypothetical protein C7212DRAFT_345367 [Tuber magnatum]